MDFGEVCDSRGSRAEPAGLGAFVQEESANGSGCVDIHFERASESLGRLRLSLGGENSERNLSKGESFARLAGRRKEARRRIRLPLTVTAGGRTMNGRNSRCPVV